MKPVISQIAAMDLNRVIGSENGLPWHMPTDMKFFRDKTRGKPVIMGRKTFEALGKPLPGRPNIIISRNEGYKIDDATVFQSLEKALDFAKTLPEAKEEIFIIGGAEIYKLALPYTDRIYLTFIEARVTGGDAFFPELPSEFRLVSEDPHPADDKNPFAFNFKVFSK